ncbi:MAG: response regulator [Myxococcota bacterium]
MRSTILIAQADHTSLELITAVLLRDGFDVVSTPDGGDALSRFLEQPPDVAICSENLPVISGEQLGRRIKETHHPTRVVLLGTPRNDEQKARLLEQTGFDAVLGRPFDYRELKALLETWNLRPKPTEEIAAPVSIPQELRPELSIPKPEVPTLVGIPTLVAPPDLQTLTTSVVTSSLTDTPLAIPLPLMPTATPHPEPPSDTLDHGEEFEFEFSARDATTVPLHKSSSQTTGLPPTPGTLDNYPLPKLITELYWGTFTGRLDLKRQGLSRAIYCRGGMPVRVDSDQLSENLGRILIEHGRITEDEYHKAQEVAQKQGVRQGESLVAIGAITQSDLLEALQLQTEQKLLNVLAWRDGTYEITTCSLPENIVVSEIHPWRAIWRGIHEHYDGASLLDYFNPLAEHYAVATDVFPVHFKHFDPHLRRIAIDRILNGQRRFRELFGDKTDNDKRGKIARILYALVVTGMVRAQPSPGSPLALPQTQVSTGSATPWEELRRTSEAIAQEYLRLKNADHFCALDTHRNASREEVDAAYEGVARRFQHDRLPPGLSETDLKRVQEINDMLKRAKSILHDPEERSRYLNALRFAASQRTDDSHLPLAPKSPQLQQTPSQPTNPTPREDRAHSNDPVIAAERLYEKGQDFLEEGQVQTARKLFEEAINKNPAEPMYRVAMSRAVQLEKPGGIDNARLISVSCLQQALKLEPSHIEANLEMAQLLTDMGFVERAKPCLERVLRRAPENQRARALRARLT